MNQWQLDMWQERTILLLTQPVWERGKEKTVNRREKRVGFFRERSFTFSLEFLAIGPLDPGKTRDKVAPHGKGYVWTPILWIFYNFRR